MVADACLCEMSNGFERLAKCSTNRVALDGRVFKVKLAGQVQRFLMGAAGDAMGPCAPYALSLRRLTDADALAMTWMRSETHAHATGRHWRM